MTMVAGGPARLGPVLAEVRRRLAGAGVESADLDARLLLQMALGLERIAIAVDRDREVGSDALARLEALVLRRLGHEPVSRIAGRREFWSLELALSADTLDPRPDTEAVVEAALEAVQAIGHHPMTIADLGTGTGAILLALLHELPDATGLGVDRSPGAVAMAHRNAMALGLEGRARFLVGDWSSALPAASVDLLVSNPPYISSGEITRLPPEVSRFDPLGALDGGPDGLDAYRDILADAPRVVRPGGILVLELGAGQLEPVTALVSEAGLVQCAVRRDLAGISRALVARRT